MMLKCCIMKKEEPKQFILDKQFWVVMKEKGKHPYFCALIKSPQDKWFFLYIYHLTQLLL